jgi:hypothetical protein
MQNFKETAEIIKLLGEAFSAWLPFIIFIVFVVSLFFGKLTISEFIKLIVKFLGK